MIIAGGAYLERCITPSVFAFLGSGGRATLALRHFEETKLHTFSPNAMEVRTNFGANSVVYQSSTQIEFAYLHPLAVPTVSGAVTLEFRTMEVVGERILRFGCLEGAFRLDANWAIVDPQSDVERALFNANGSKAQRLAIILNLEEARQATGEVDPSAAAQAISRGQCAEAVVIKMGAQGALVYDRLSGAVSHVPAFKTEAVYKIGSGDVFSAIFAHHWATKQRSPSEAAYFASQHVAAYVASRCLPCERTPRAYPAADARSLPLNVVTVGDDDSVASQWLAYEAEGALVRLGASSVFPYAHLNSGWTGTDVLFALATKIDGPAMNALRAAQEAGIPSICFSEAQEIRSLAVTLGATASADFAGALYGVFWRG